MTDRVASLPPYIGMKQCACGPMMYLNNDRYVGRLLDQTGEFGKIEKELFRRLIPERGTVLDIGANIGAFTIPFSQMVGAGGLVVAFEPQRTICNILCANLAINGADNVIAHNVALGERSGYTKVEALQIDANMNNFGSARVTDGHGDICRLERLDVMNFPKVDFMKIDVEGHEKQVLRGAAETIKRCRPIIFMENDREPNSDILIEMMLNWDYRIWWSLAPLTTDQSVLFEEDRHDVTICSIDLLCIPAESSAEGLGNAAAVRRGETWPEALDRINQAEKTT